MLLNSNQTVPPPFSLNTATNSRSARCPRWSEPNRQLFFEMKGKPPDPNRKRALMASGEEGDSFQHFIDTALPKISHVWDLVGKRHLLSVHSHANTITHCVLLDPAVFKDISIVAMTSHRWPFVGQFIERLGFSTCSLFLPLRLHYLLMFPEHIVAPGYQITPEQFVWPCTAPLRHPYQWQRIRQQLGLNHSNPDANKVTSSRIHSRSPTQLYILFLLLLFGFFFFLSLVSELSLTRTIHRSLCCHDLWGATLMRAGQ